jgi:hypothetical protein
MAGRLLMICEGGHLFDFVESISLLIFVVLRLSLLCGKMLCVNWMSKQR